MTTRRLCLQAVVSLTVCSLPCLNAFADAIPAEMLDPNLDVTTVVDSGISQPMGIVFLSATDFFVLEKATGRVLRVTDGAIQPAPVLDLAVNSYSERGLLSMALHPNFPGTPYVYVRWTESSTGMDTSVETAVALLGNRLDRFIWNGSTLTFDRNLILLRAGPRGGTHNGGVVKFGPDGKIYVFVGDRGLRGWMQNLPNGPFLAPPFVDDDFGGPAPDNAHLTGVILRLNDDGSTPSDNPLFSAGAALGGEVGANIQKVYSYGHRNGFGMAFDPGSGHLWETENGDDSFSELNRITAGMNGGWIQIAGPLARFAQFKLIETTQFTRTLQTASYPPTRLAYTAALALARMYVAPGSTYRDPEFSWKYDVAPSGAAFVAGTALGSEYTGTFWTGSATPFRQVGGTGGSLYRFRLTLDRLKVDVTGDPRLSDQVADNLQKFEVTESESLIIGRGFGTTSDIAQGPDGNLYVVSISDGAIRRISRRP